MTPKIILNNPVYIFLIFLREDGYYQQTKRVGGQMLCILPSTVIS